MQILNSGISLSGPNEVRVFNASSDSFLAEEILVVAERAAQRPAQTVKHRLRRMLETSIGVSQIEVTKPSVGSVNMKNAAP